MLSKILTAEGNFRKRHPMVLHAAVLSVFAACMYAAFPFVFADGAAVVNGVVQIVAKICAVVGVLFVLVGVVKLAISYANEDGPAQQKAAMMIATGVVLVILGATNILNIDFAGWLS